MRKRDAIKLHNRDEVLVKTYSGWEQGYVLGEPKEVFSKCECGEHIDSLLIPTQTNEDGFMWKTHREVR